MLMYGVVWVSLIWMYWTEVRRTPVMGKDAPASPLASAADKAVSPASAGGFGSKPVPQSAIERIATR
jgi:hypothetical protein